MVACNPRDREAAHRAEVEGIATEDPSAVTCRRCRPHARGRWRSAPAAVDFDFATHPIGIILLDGRGEEPVVELIAAGTTLPCTVSRRFTHRGVGAVVVEVTEGAGARGEDVHVIARCELPDLPPRTGGAVLEIVGTYSVDQTLEVEVVDVETGVSRSVDIRFMRPAARP